MRAGILLLVNILLFIGIVDALFFYSIRTFFIKKKYSKIITSLFWLLTLLFVTGFIYLVIKNRGNITPKDYYYLTFFNGVFFLTYIPKIVFLVYKAFVWILSGLFSLIQKRRKANPKREDYNTRKITRASFLGKIGMAVAAAPFLTILYGMAKGRFNFYIKTVPLKIINLPHSFDGFKIIQISDIHLGNFNKEYHLLHEVTSMVNAENPDLIVMTGDMVNNFASETYGWETVFRKMKAPFGKFSILGNHDYGDYSRWKSQHDKRRNFDEIINSHERFGFKLLRNEHADINSGKDKIALIGVENWGKPPFPQYGDLKKSLESVSPDVVKILLSHDPDHWEAEVLKQTNVDLTLAGHTHGMQLGVKFKNAVWSPAKYKYKHWDGLYQQNNQSLYVNRGLGFIGIPMRVGMPPEITLFTLHKS